MLFSFANSLSYSVVSNVCLTDCPVKFANAGQRENVTGSRQEKLREGAAQKKPRTPKPPKKKQPNYCGKLQNNSFDRNYEGHALSC